MKIWHRFFFTQILKIFFLFLGILFLLFVIMDFSLNMPYFMKSSALRFSDLSLYYFYQFIKRLEILLPLALLTSMIQVLCSLNLHHEWLALQISGLSTKTLIKSLFLIAACCTALNIINLQYILPKALNFTDNFQKNILSNRNNKQNKTNDEKLKVLYLTDGTKLIYQKYDEIKACLFDVFWILSPFEIWHSKYLDQNLDVPEGKFVDFLKKNEDGIFEKSASFEAYSFHGMKLESLRKKYFFIPLENRSISQLFLSLFESDISFQEQSGAIKTQLYYKLLLSFIPLLTILGIVPYCISYNRNLRVFLIYSFGFAATIAFFMIMDACLIFGENEVMSPFLAIFPIPLILSALFGWKFYKTC